MSENPHAVDGPLPEGIKPMPMWTFECPRCNDNLLGFDVLEQRLLTIYCVGCYYIWQIGVNTVCQEQFEELQEAGILQGKEREVRLMLKIRGEKATRRVWIGDRELLPARSQQVMNHSPSGFNWGYGGSGPAQLALALLLEYTDQETALKLHQRFKWDVIAILEDDFEFSEPVVRAWVWAEEGEHVLDCSASL